MRATVTPRLTTTTSTTIPSASTRLPHHLPDDIEARPFPLPAEDQDDGNAAVENDYEEGDGLDFSDELTSTAATESTTEVTTEVTTEPSTPSTEEEEEDSTTLTMYRRYEMFH